MNLENYIRNVKDFPKQGINFKDITPLLLSAEAIKYSLDQMIEQLPKVRIDKVIGIESRGFFMAPLLAQALQAGFVPVRKPGKLPYKTISESYQLEYRTDTLEIHQDAILPGDLVLIHDDVLATGGTAKAAVDLVKRLGGNVVHCNFLIELSFLNGKDKIKDISHFSVLRY